MTKKKKSPVNPFSRRRAPSERRKNPFPRHAKTSDRDPFILKAMSGDILDEGEIAIPQELPVLAVRDIVLFNSMILPLFVGREKSVKAVENALEQNRQLLILTQKDENREDPSPDEMYAIGTVGRIMRVIKMTDGKLKVLVQGVVRAKVKRFVQEEPYLSATIKPLPDIESKFVDAQLTALMRTIRDQSEKILNLRGLSSSDIMNVLNGVEDPGLLADLVAANLRMAVEDAQSILECVDPSARLDLVAVQLLREIEVANMQNRIKSMAKNGMDKAQRDFYLREQIKAIKRELGGGHEANDEIEDIRLSIEKAKMPKDVCKEALKQLRRLESMHSESSEATVIRNYLDWMVELPWKKSSRDRLDIKKAEAILHEDHYGLLKVKERMLEYLSVRKLNPQMKGSILCLVGPPGVGKTSLGRSVARSLGRKFYRLSLGGMRDEAEIRGHRRTYVGSMPGRIIQGIHSCDTNNPVIMLDEVDKLGSDFRGDPSSALLEVLDPEQNFTFIDHYLNVPFDLSKVMFLCTANRLDTIPQPLLDRMEMIRIEGYTEHEKVKIARQYVIPRQVEENGLKQKDFVLSDSVIREIIQGYTREAGLRNLEREIASLCRKMARRKAEGEKGPFRITSRGVHKLLGIPRYQDDEQEKQLPPGVAMGLAWTPYGGQTLHVEVTTMPGKGKLILTGKLGDVMKESAQAAMSFARSHAESYAIDASFVEELDIHVHVPAGATPKDGPSAGVTLVTALISALSGKSVRADLAMTGEISLRGKVLPVGGIKEKVLAAVAMGMQEVLIPLGNKKDLADIPAELRRRINITLVEKIKEVWPIAKSPESVS